LYVLLVSVLFVVVWGSLRARLGGTLSNVMLFLAALEKCLADQGVDFERGTSIAAAVEASSK
jgi:hypothetical protein